MNGTSNHNTKTFTKQICKRILKGLKGLALFPKKKANPMYKFT